MPGRLVGRAGQEVHFPGGRGPSSPILLQEGDFSHTLPFPSALGEAEAGPGWPPGDHVTGLLLEGGRKDRLAGGILGWWGQRAVRGEGGPVAPNKGF